MKMRLEIPGLLALAVIAIVPTLAGAAPLGDETVEDFERQVAALDNNEFGRRQRAVERLQELAQDKAIAEGLAELVQHKLLADSPSFEVRAFLEDYAKRLPAVVLAPPSDISSEQLDELLAQLDDASSSVRVGAARRINWLAQSPKISLQVWKRLDERLSSKALSFSDLKRWEDLRNEMRSAWLASGGDWHDLPKASDRQIDQWLDELTAADENESRQVNSAYKALENALLRDDQVLMIRERVRLHLRERPSRSAIAQIDQLLEWTRPAMVAEIWRNHELYAMQHLTVGIPQINPQPLPSTHFDRIDDDTAHCVSGVNLAPGDYPVGVGNTKTRFEDEPPSFDNLQNLYQLVNLTTPRRRMAYEFQIKRDERLRFREMSQRTVDWYLRRGTPLKEPEIVTLAQLDSEVVSKFVGIYFAAVEDQPFPQQPSVLTEQASTHRAICLMLVRVGTPSAVAALEELGKKMELTEKAPVNIAWLAALVIAHRQPWPEVDDWLAGLALRTDRLLLKTDVDANLGATAAAMLLRRHEQPSQDFGLEQAAISGPLGPPQFEQLGLKIYRATQSQREAVIAWWNKQKLEGDKATAG